MIEVRWFATNMLDTSEWIECEDRDHVTAVIRFHDQGTWMGYGLIEIGGQWCYAAVARNGGREWACSGPGAELWYVPSSTLEIHGLKNDT